MYFITHGPDCGAFMVYIKERSHGDSLAFLLIPNPMEGIYKNRKIFEESLKNGDIEYVEIINKDVYEVCRANFDYYYTVKRE